MDKEGLPLVSDLFPGNRQDVTTVQQMGSRLKAGGVKRCIFVADRGTVSEKNLAVLKAADMETLVGRRMRQVNEGHQQALSKRGRFIELPCGLGGKEVKMAGYRYIVVRNPPQARKEAKLRQEIVERLETLREQIRAGNAAVCDIQPPPSTHAHRWTRQAACHQGATGGQV